jgi:hypothetical protein
MPNTIAALILEPTEPFAGRAHVTTRQQRPPWERRRTDRRHPLGRTRRRWPRAFDGGHEPQRPTPRYVRAFERDALRSGARGTRRRAMQRLRESPVRNGLIGLAIAGTAAPIGVNRYQQSLRTDATHERIVTRAPSSGSLGEDQVRERWKAMMAAEVERAALDAEAGIADREALIANYVEILLCYFDLVAPQRSEVSGWVHLRRMTCSKSSAMTARRSAATLLRPTGGKTPRGRGLAGSALSWAGWPQSTLSVGLTER